MSAVTANLLAMILLPLTGGLLLLVAKWPAATVRQFALVVSSVTLVLSMILVGQFQGVPAPRPDAKTPIHPRIELKRDWMTFECQVPPGQSWPAKFRRDVHLEFFLGMDGISLSLVVLTTLLTFSAVLISWHAISDRHREYFASLLILEAGLSGAFCGLSIWSCSTSFSSSPCCRCSSWSESGADRSAARRR